MNPSSPDGNRRRARCRRGPGAWSWALAAVLAAGACGRGAAPTDRPRGDTGAAAMDAAALSDSALIEGIAANDPLPPLHLSDLNRADHALLAPGDDVTVVNFWASWCTPCLAEIPQLVAFHDHWRQAGVRVVGIAVASGDAGEIRRFAAAHRMDYDLLAMEEDAARGYFGRLRLLPSLPITLVVDRRGMIRWKFLGPHTEPQFAAAARRALDAGR